MEPFSGLKWKIHQRGNRVPLNHWEFFPDQPVSIYLSIYRSIYLPIYLSPYTPSTFSVAMGSRLLHWGLQGSLHFPFNIGTHRAKQLGGPQLPRYDDSPPAAPPCRSAPDLSAGAGPPRGHRAQLPPRPKGRAGLSGYLSRG